MQYILLALIFLYSSNNYLSAGYEITSGKFTEITKPIYLRNLNPPHRTPEKLTKPLTDTDHTPITFINILTVDEIIYTSSPAIFSSFSDVNLTLPVTLGRHVDFTNEAVGVKILESNLEILREEDITPKWIKSKR